MTTNLASGSAIIVLALMLLATMLMVMADSGNAPALQAMPDGDLAEGSSVMFEMPDQPQDQVETSTKKETEIKRNATFENNAESGFMPSFHLGPTKTFPGPAIDLQRQGTNTPFNADPQHVQFTAGDRPSSPFNSLRVIKFGNGQEDQHQTQRKQEPPFRPSEEDKNYVKFVDDKSDQDKRPHCENCAKNENDRHGEPGSEQVAPQKIYPEQQQQVAYVVENYDNGQQQYATYETKPSKFHDSTGYQVHYHHSVVPSENSYAPFQQSQVDSYQSDEKFIEPETVINVHPASYHAASYDGVTKPKTVVYVTSHEMTRTRKLPYHYYQPQIYEHSEEPIVVPEHEEPYQYPLFHEHHPKSISPWKKILHIIGAFLPLGLLFALLSPKVISAGQSQTENPNNDPNIILSKLRVNDLPAEHKNNRLVLDIDACEERSICRLVHAANSVSASFLRHLLLHINDRTPESAVRKKELDRIFEAAKLGNCDILTCNFYDGT